MGFLMGLELLLCVWYGFCMEMCEVDELVGGGSVLVARLMAAAREGHLCLEGGEVDCEVEELRGDEEWFGKISIKDTIRTLLLQNIKNIT